MNTYHKLLEEVNRIANGCGREASSIKIVAISKYQPIESLQKLYEEGCRNFGENRVQEALEKQGALPSDIQWHFTGTLQKNKVSKIINRFVLVHSVDSFELAEKISDLSLLNGVKTQVLLQVNTSNESSKHGLTSHEWQKFQNPIRRLQGIEIQGFMTMGPKNYDPKIIRKCFRELRLIKDEWGLKELSMGMSADFQIAIEEGSTILRIGNWATRSP